MTDASRPPSYSKPPLDALLEAQAAGYVGVHVEQGVPVLDRDLNLLGDLLLANFRTVVGRYLGDGVAAGSEAFAVRAVTEPNDFEIHAGAVPPGRCLVGGIEVGIDTSLRYRQQAGDDPDDGPAELTTPDDDEPDPREDTVYLDVWLAEERGLADDSLLNRDDVGMRTSTRTQPAWRVRVVEGDEPPEPEPGHVHYPLARLRRPRGEDRIADDHVTDLRNTHLNLAQVQERVRVLERLPERLLPDLFGLEPSEYEQGEGRPAISARETLNTLLRGEMPGTPLRPIAVPDVEHHDAHAARAADGSVVAAWVQDLAHEDDQAAVMVRRLRDQVAESPRQITRGADTAGGPWPYEALQVVPLPDGRVLVAYLVPSGGGSGEKGLRFKLGTLDELADAHVHEVEALEFMLIQALQVVISGDVLAFFVWASDAARMVRLRWEDDPDDWWLDDSAVIIEHQDHSGEEGGSGVVSAAADGEGRYWVAFHGHGSVRIWRVDAQTASTEFVTDLYMQSSPVLHHDRNGVVWLLRLAVDGPLCSFVDGDQFRHASSPPPAPGEAEFGGHLAMTDAGDGALWVFWLRKEPWGFGERGVIRGARLDPSTGEWSNPLVPVPPRADCESPIAVTIDDARISLLCRVRSDGKPWRVHHRQIVTGF